MMPMMDFYVRFFVSTRHNMLTVSRFLLRFSMIFITMIVGLMINMITAIAIIMMPATTAVAPFSSNDLAPCWRWPASVTAVVVALPPSPYDGDGGWLDPFTWFRPLRNSIALTVHQAITCDTMTKYLANALPLIGITLALDRFPRKRDRPSFLWKSWIAHYKFIIIGTFVSL